MRDAYYDQLRTIVDDVIALTAMVRQSLASATLALLDREPTALFCYNDRMAMGAYRAAADRGLRIPDDLSVVGFDDQAPLPESLFPALTTVALPHYEMGAWAVAALAESIHGTGEAALLAAHPTVLDCPLVERDSVAPPRERAVA